MLDLLDALIQSPLGFTSFRPYQEDVCQALIEGKDSLLVMPTGAGKSLCYQLPGLVLRGTTLVISPLIALMEDQVLKLQQKGLRAERIHGGRDRAASRKVCFDYLEGKLDYLYIAPERLGVPQFPEMLAKRKPVVIAVDEAHCISQWGHDFRPDYRRLQERLSLLRPCPILAVTATATKLVQDDIVKQLALEKARRFIHGFRRDNIAIEVVEMSNSEREPQVLSLLEKPERRPAIVYAPTRKSTQSLGELLRSKFPAESYHAGLTASERDRIQRAFLDGSLDVIVATIAFGMGIDKSNVRTVIHIALPGSVEAYYQEIGRAGRDGAPSRAVLLHSYSDRRTHDFFFERDYPEPQVLKQIYDKTNEAPIPKTDLMERASLEPESFERALEKLWIHQGVEITFSEEITRGNKNWMTSYRAQRQHKTTQLDQVSDYVRSKGCRMGHLVSHFGDDPGKKCGNCDFCDGEQCWVRTSREPNEAEIEVLDAIYQKLASRPGISVGQLHLACTDNHQITGALTRDQFENVVEALARAGQVRVSPDSFEKDGRLISFQRVYLLNKISGKTTGFSLSAVPNTPTKTSKRKKSASKKSSPATNSRATSSGPLDGSALELFKRLRDWRLTEARKWEIPAFCILSDRVMRSIAESTPKTEQELLGISGIGPKLFQKHGRQILEIVSSAN